MARIAQERFHKGESSLIAIVLFDGFYAAELEQRLPASFDRRKAGSRFSAVCRAMCSSNSARRRSSSRVDVDHEVDRRNNLLRIFISGPELSRQEIVR
jgi:hypothetical protein